MLSCFFIGHHNAPEAVKPHLADAIERHIMEYGVTEFVVGHYGAIDRMAESALRTAKAAHPEIYLRLLLPYHPHDHPVEAPLGFDDTFYPPGMETVPRRVAILRANRYMIDHSDFLIAFDRGQFGNTSDLVEAARRRERKGLIQIENLAEKY